MSMEQQRLGFCFSLSVPAGKKQRLAYVLTQPSCFYVFFSVILSNRLYFFTHASHLPNTRFRIELGFDSIRHGPPPPTKTMVNALLPREFQEVGHGPFPLAFTFSLKVILAWKNPSLRRAQSVQVARKSRIKVRG